MKVNCLALLTTGSLVASAYATELPEPTLPAGVGVNIHFVTGHQADLGLIAEAGFKFIRMDFAWAATETAKGRYDWSEYDELVTNLEHHKLRAIFILDYSNPLYEETVTSPHPQTGQPHKTTASPQHPESVAAFARWSAAAAKHFHGRHILWEIWNEPNGQFWAPKPDADQYTTLAIATCKAIRETEPSATIIGPASAAFPWGFLKTFLKSGVLEYLDAVSVHPYRGPQAAPETAAADYQKLRELIAQYAPANKTNLSILSGEWGYSSFSHGVSLETQAAFAARQQLFNLWQGVPLSIWYDWKNDGDDPNENEHNFGTVLPDLKPKPAYVALRTLTRQLSGYHIVKRVPVTAPEDYMLLCANASGDYKLAAWTTGKPHTASVPVAGAGAELTGVAGNGEAFTSKIESGNLLLDLTPSPRYIGLGKARVRME